MDVCFAENRLKKWWPLWWVQQKKPLDFLSSLWNFYQEKEQRNLNKGDLKCWHSTVTQNMKWMVGKNRHFKNQSIIFNHQSKLTWYLSGMWPVKMLARSSVCKPAFWLSPRESHRTNGRGLSSPLYLMEYVIYWKVKNNNMKRTFLL